MDFITEAVLVQSPPGSDNDADSNDFDDLDDQTGSDTWPDDAWDDGIAQNADELVHRDELPERQVSLFYPSPPLGFRAREIRLLRVMPGQVDSTICCSLYICPLSDDPDFEAVSYAWGDSTNTCHIKVNECNLSVNRNLWSALRRLRYADRPRVLWADALCINQTDASERNHQVAFMADIYRSASRVLIWLGDAEVKFKTLNDPSLLRFNMSAFEASRQDHLEQSLTSAIFQSNSKWWTRLWTVQEFVVAANEPMICFAEYCLPLSEFCNTTSLLNLIPELRTAFAALTEIASLYKDSKVDFRYLLSRTADLHATEHRDKIYALLGLVDPQQTLELKPDYAKPVADTFCRATSVCFAADPKLACLAVAHVGSFNLNRAYLGVHEFPSWAIDFAFLKDCHIAQYLMPGPAAQFLEFAKMDADVSWNELLQAGNHLQINADHQSLSCVGYLLGKVSEASMLGSFSSTRDLQQVANRPVSDLERLEIQAWVTGIPPVAWVDDRFNSFDRDTLLRKILEHVPYPISQGSCNQCLVDLSGIGGDRFGRGWSSNSAPRYLVSELCGGTEKAGIFPHSIHHLGAMLRQLLLKICFPGLKEVEFSRFDDYVHAASNATRPSIKLRRLLKTQTGDLGLGLESVSKGDTIAMLLPDQLLVALRSVDRANEPRRYRFMGFVLIPILKGVSCKDRPIERFEIV